MATLPASLRLTCWVASFSVHGAALIAASHGPEAAAGAERTPSRDILVDLASELETQPSERQTTSAQKGSIAPPTHHHPYPVRWDHDAHPHDPWLVHPPIAAASEAASVRETETQRAPPMRFTMVVASDNRPPALGTPGAPAKGPASDPDPGGDALPLPEERVSSPARLATPIAPPYPPEARAQEIEADVVLAIVVRSNGEVADARVVQRAGFGFDEAALRAVRAARFIPAQNDARRVAVQMRWTVSFRLR
jgi:TonB family protein